MPAQPESASRAQRRQTRTFRRRRLVVGGAALALVLAVAGAAVAITSGGDDRRSTGTTSTTERVGPTTTTSAPNNGPFTVATAAVAKLKVFAQPNIFGDAVATLKATTDYGLTTTLLTDPTRQPDSNFVPVLTPLHKPNDTPGWVLAKEVKLSQTPYAIDINLASHTLVVLNAGQPVLSTKVIVGALQSPTPTGRFYLTDPVNCNTMSVPGYPVAKCRKVYGAFAIGTSGLSEALDSFSGTVPQIAIHGTDLPDSAMGQNLSNGCVRVPNAIILQIAKLTPLLGIPVTITA